jgi:hypothetical protein
MCLAAPRFTSLWLLCDKTRCTSVHPSSPRCVGPRRRRQGADRRLGASPGTGTPGHLVGEQFRLSLGLDLVHIPFNSAGLAIGSTVAGHTPIAFTTPPPVVPQVKEGKLRALAVACKMRSRALPDVPTMAEADYPGIEGEAWFAVIVPAKTPKEIPSGGRQAHRAAGYEGAVGSAGFRAGRQYARRVCCPIQDRNREMGEGDSTGGHQGAIRRTDAAGSITKPTTARL